MFFNGVENGVMACRKEDPVFQPQFLMLVSNSAHPFSSFPVTDIRAACLDIFFLVLAMESRKRPHSTESEPTIQKKRILTGVNGNPHVNGVVSEAEEPNDADNLEVNIMKELLRFKW